MCTSFISRRCGWRHCRRLERRKGDRLIRSARSLSMTIVALWRSGGSDKYIFGICKHRQICIWTMSLQTKTCSEDDITRHINIFLEAVNTERCLIGRSPHRQIYNLKVSSQKNINFHSLCLCVFLSICVTSWKISSIYLQECNSWFGHVFIGSSDSELSDYQF